MYDPDLPDYSLTWHAVSRVILLFSGEAAVIGSVGRRWSRRV